MTLCTARRLHSNPDTSPRATTSRPASSTAAPSGSPQFTRKKSHISVTGGTHTIHRKMCGGAPARPGHTLRIECALGESRLGHVSNNSPQKGYKKGKGQCMCSLQFARGAPWPPGSWRTRPLAGQGALQRRLRIPSSPLLGRSRTGSPSAVSGLRPLAARREAPP